jgi:hypothetical protein
MTAVEPTGTEVVVPAARGSFPDAVRLVFRTAAEHPRACLFIASIYALLSGLMNAVFRSSTGIVDPTTLPASDVAAAGVQALVAMGILVVVNIGIGPVTLGAMSLVGSAAVYDDEVDTSGIIRRALDRALDAIATALVIALLLGLPLVVLALVSAVLMVAVSVVGFGVLLFGSIVLGIPLLYGFVRLSLAIPVVMREGRGPLDALRRSWALTHGVWWRVFGVAVVMALCIGIVMSFVSVQSFFGRDTLGDFVVGVLLTTIAAAVLVTLYGLASGVVYAQLAPEDTVPPDVAASEARVAAQNDPGGASSSGDNT